MMVIEKIATGNPELPRKKDKGLRKAKRWLRKHDRPLDDIEIDGGSRRGHTGKGGGFYENMGENSGGITFIGQGEGYRRAV
jgi:hypothetical protein